MKTINQNLNTIYTILKENIPDNIKIYDIVYRPFDMGVFGKKGYSFVLASSDGKKRIGWRLTTVSKIQIKRAVKRMLGIINKEPNGKT